MSSAMQRKPGLIPDNTLTQEFYKCLVGNTMVTRPNRNTTNNEEKGTKFQNA